MKNMNNIIYFTGGMVMGIMYSKYERKINRYVRSMMMKLD